MFASEATKYAQVSQTYAGAFANMLDQKSPAFRADIEGLRGIAVLLVVLFHFNLLWLQSGFIGVDIFFVISGFLMTQILTNPRFSWSFTGILASITKGFGEYRLHTTSYWYALSV